MLLRQIRYFQSVVRHNSFTEAAEEHHISQSAISQQIQVLEQELGVKLLARKNRKFTMTPAGEHFYQRSLILTSDLERLCCETVRLGRKDEARLTVGYLRRYGGSEFHAAIGVFQGVMPIEGIADSVFFGSALKRIPLTHDGEQVRRTYCAFWKKDNPGRYMEPFAALLKAQFADIVSLLEIRTQFAEMLRERPYCCYTSQVVQL